ncbi:MAG TPA: biotin/lipoyl-containing protein, partial [Burkholderiales bacterium]|nr:biotin/lipoyl-containing protein [Burkholderiales bacterium]
MLVEVKVPQLSESVAEATLLAWHKKAGEAVKRDENLIDIETDKVVLELPAPVDGVLAKVLKGDGSTVVSGEIIAAIDTEAKAVAGAAATAPAVRAEPVAVAPTPAPEPAAARQDARLMPAARKLVEERAVDPTKITGSGREGRITKADVIEQLVRSQAPAAPPPAAPAPKPALAPAPPPVSVEKVLSGRPEERVPMSRLRARIAERLVQSQSTAAILTTFNEVNMQPVIELRNKYKDAFEKKHGVKLGFSSFFVKAVVQAL